MDAQLSSIIPDLPTYCGLCVVFHVIAVHKYPITNE